MRLTFSALLLVLPLLLGAAESDSSSSSGSRSADRKAYLPTGYYAGVNLAGAEFGKSGTRLGTDYIYPKKSEFAYFHSKGMRVIRLPFKWHRIQPEVGGELDPANLKELDRCVGHATMAILLDVHNYGGRRVDGKGHQIGLSDKLTMEDFNDLWVRLANRYKDNPLVWFGLMNEPHKHKADLIAQIMQSAVLAIRKTGARNLITVSGTAWSGAHSWIKSGNAKAFEKFTDPANNFVFEVHQYLDKWSSGTEAKATPDAGSKRLVVFTAWAKAHGYKAFLGEFGWDQNPENTQAQKEGKDLLIYMDQHRDVWMGYSYWAAGPWWPRDYIYSLQPTGLKEGNPVDQPQMAILSQHLR